MENSKKQTAVEFAEELINVILYYLDDDELERIKEVFDEAKEMEKQQRGYSEEDLKAAYNAESEGWSGFDFWFEQFKTNKI